VDWGLAWKLILVWFALVIVIFAIAGGWSLIVFAIGFGIILGGVFYRYRRYVRPFFHRLRLDNYAGFFLLSLVVTVVEETLCYLAGNRIAYPVLWIDLIMVFGMWAVWFGTWYFYLSKKYAFQEKEALMIASVTGIMYEYLSSGMFPNPLALLILTPLAVVVYAGIFVLPMQLIDFTGTDNRLRKYLVSIVLPYILTIPVAVAIYIILSLLQVW
jgi:hypothetical protein